MSQQRPPAPPPQQSVRAPPPGAMPPGVMQQRGGAPPMSPMGAASYPVRSHLPLHLQQVGGQSVPPSAAGGQSTMLPQSMAPGGGYDRVRMWDSYAIPDSGIHSGMQSGIQSGAPSVMSHVSSLHDEVIQSYEQMSVSGGGSGGGPNMSLLGDVAKSCDAARGLVDLFTDTDMVVTCHAAETANALLKSQVHVESVKRGDPLLMQSLIEAILKALDRIVSKPGASATALGAAGGGRAAPGGKDEEEMAAMKWLSSSISQLTKYADCAAGLVQFGTVPLVARALQWRPDGADHSYFCFLVVALHNLLAKSDEAVRQLRAIEAERVLVPLITQPSPAHQHGSSWQKLVSIIVDCLHHACTAKSAPKKRILQLGGTAKLVEVMKTADYEKLLYLTARLLKVLSTCPENKRTIVACGGLNALAGRLDHASQRLLTNCLMCLRNLSDLLAKTDQNVQEIMDRLLFLLGSQDHEVVECCAGILQNITSGSPVNKRYICDVSEGRQWLEHLLRALGSNMQWKKNADAIICTLRHLTNGHELEEAARQTIVHHEALPLIFELIQKRYAPLVKSGWGLMKNLAQSDVVRPAIVRSQFPAFPDPDRSGPVRRSIGFTDLAAQTFALAYGAVMEAVDKNQDPATLEFDGVKAYQLLHLPLAFLVVMACDPHARQQIRDSNDKLIGYLMQVLSKVDHQPSLVAALDLLTHLAEEPDGARMIEQAHQRCANLFNHLAERHRDNRIGEAASRLTQKLNEYLMSRTNMVLSGGVVTMMDDDPWGPNAESMATDFDSGMGSAMDDNRFDIAEPPSLFHMQQQQQMSHQQHYMSLEQPGPSHYGGAYQQQRQAPSAGPYAHHPQQQQQPYPPSQYAAPPPAGVYSADVYMAAGGGMDGPTPSPAAAPTTPNYGAPPPPSATQHPNTPLQQPLPPSLPPQR